MKVLKEADEININQNTNQRPKQNVDFNQRFKSTTNPDEIIKIFKDFLRSANFKNYDEEKWNDFVDNNFDTLTIECQYYGLSMENPFFQFLKTYATKNENIDPFVDDSKYKLLHNLVSDRYIESKQLSFKCPEDEQIRILLNPNLWKLPNGDINYLIKLYVWFIDTDLNRYIINSWVKAGFKGKFKTFNDQTAKIALIKCCMFTNYIDELDKEKKAKNDDPKIPLKEFNDKLTKITGDNMLVSGEFMPINMIYHQVYLLKEGAQESNRGVDGQYQQTDVDNNVNSSTKKWDNFTRVQKFDLNNIKSNVLSDIKKNINSKLGTKYSDEDVLDILRYYLNKE